MNKLKREILFRGKREKNNEWTYGFLVRAENVITEEKETFIIDSEATYYGYGEFDIVTKVLPETVGQHTGLTDKNGIGIYEGDIVKTCYTCGENAVLAVKFSSVRGGWFPYACGDGCGCCEEDTYLPEYTEVIGNIYDKPELLGETK